MAGWRIGMVAASEHNINCILKVKSNFDSGMFKPIQQAAIKALELSEEWYVKLNIEYSLRREIMWNILDVLDCTYNRKSSGLFIWAEIPSNYNNSEDFSDYLLYEKKIFATPGTVFGDNGKKYIRFSLCSHLEVLKEVLNRLKK
jgi:aspartate/methionine/tyrosine aminotransferase